MVYRNDCSEILSETILLHKHLYHKFAHAWSKNSVDMAPLTIYSVEQTLRKVY